MDYRLQEENSRKKAQKAHEQKIYCTTNDQIRSFLRRFYHGWHREHGWRGRLAETTGRLPDSESGSLPGIRGIGEIRGSISLVAAALLGRKTPRFPQAAHR
jgi:hypothetical protein